MCMTLNNLEHVCQCVLSVPEEFGFVRARYVVDDGVVGVVVVVAVVADIVQGVVIVAYINDADAVDVVIIVKYF